MTDSLHDFVGGGLVFLMKGCKHIGCLSITKLADRLELDGIDGDTTSHEEVWVCAICLVSFSSGQTAFLHGNKKNHQMFFKKDLQYEGLYCSKCSKDVDEAALNTKQKGIVVDAIKMIQEALSKGPTVKQVLAREENDREDGVIESGHFPSGLNNLGNTCFMNAALQALSACWFTCAADLEPDLDPLGPIGVALLGTIKNIPRSAADPPVVSDKKKKRSHGNVVDPSTFLATLSKRYKEFKRLRQQDAHDFLRLLFNALDEEHCEARKRGKADKDAVALHQQYFAGVMVSKVTCKTCKNVTEVEETFLDLSLALPLADKVEDITRQMSLLGLGNKASRDLNLDCLMAFWARPVCLVGENAFACENCPKHSQEDPTPKYSYQPATQQFYLKTLPPCLIFHFQRFSISGVSKKGIRFTKDHTSVQIPTTIDLSPFCNSPKESARYALTALVIHEGGSADSGHYVAVVKYDQSSETWWYASDSNVKQMSFIEKYNPYLVFYTRIEK